MKEGALVLVDCLGFRGIWNRVDPETLISNLQSIEKRAASLVMPKYSRSMLSFGHVRFHLRFLSDTVALSIQYEADAYENGAQPNERQKDLLVAIACDSAGVLANLFIDSETPLPLRGCISFGRHLCESNFLVGPAVDQAAEYMNEPDGAFIWVLPRAVGRYKNSVEQSLKLIDQPKETLLAGLAIAAHQGVDESAKLFDHPDAGSDIFIDSLRMVFAKVLARPTIIEPYPMPIKSGGTVDAGIINPFISAEDDKARKRIIVRYEEFLQGDRIDIWKKRQNTLKFLAVAEKAEAGFRATLGSPHHLRP
jgi:hypothetical protein